MDSASIPLSPPGPQNLAAQLLAITVVKLFPNAVLAGGGVDSLGFYYDFLFEQPLLESMLELIEAEMFRLAKEELLVESVSMMRENAQALFEHQGHLLLAEEAAVNSSNVLDLVRIDSFYGLCPSFPFETTKGVGHVKLLGMRLVTRSFENDDVVLTRIEGCCQPSAKDLKKFIRKYDLFLKRQDHRLLGPALNLFSFSEAASNLGVVWHPKGVVLQRLLVDLVKDGTSKEVNEICSSSLARNTALKTAKNSLQPVEFQGEEYFLRSGFNQQHIAFLAASRLGIEEEVEKVFECGQLYQDYCESDQWGLFCRSSFTGEQTTALSSKSEVTSQLISSLHFIEQIITIFDFEAQWVFVASKEKGVKAKFEHEAMGWFNRAVAESSLRYPISPLKERVEGVDGPSMELRARDVLDREWVVSRVQVVSPLGASGVQENSSITVACQVFESIDRFIALLIERWEGRFPLWMAPEQVRVLAIGEASRSFAEEVVKKFCAAGIRAQCDCRETKLSVRIHAAEKECVPYLVLVGEQERTKQKIQVRTRESSHQSSLMDVEQFMMSIQDDLMNPFTGTI